MHLHIVEQEEQEEKVEQEEKEEEVDKEEEEVEQMVEDGECILNLDKPITMLRVL